jgi:ribosomal protein L11 methyltransferase
VNSAKPSPTFVARLTADEAQARRIADLMAEALNPADAACAFARPDGRWQVDLHFATPPDLDDLKAMVVRAGGSEPAETLSVEALSARDWVSESLAGLPPVAAGRFVVHGAHDRTRVRSNRIGIEIEAATAFGTGHHGTTRGCLLALDSLARLRQPRHVLDLGTGSGVLAIAAAKVFRVAILATDLDPAAVASAAANARHNGVGALVTAACADGLNAKLIAAHAPFDLVLANILLRPLQRMAAPMARMLMPNARIVLSGILAAQAPAAIAAYRSQGIALERWFALEGWATLLLVARRL